MSLSSTKSHVESPVSAPEASSEKLFHWTHRPWHDDPWFFGIVVGALVVVLLLVALVTGKVYLGVLAASAGGLICWRVLVPVAYEFESGGLRQTTWHRRRMIPWKTIAEARFLDDGLLLLPRGSQSWLGNLRGIYIPCGDNIDTVRTGLETHAPWIVSRSDESAVGGEPTSVGE
jgi:hypothetical protein